MGVMDRVVFFSPQKKHIFFAATFDWESISKNSASCNLGSKLFDGGGRVNETQQRSATVSKNKDLTYRFMNHRRRKTIYLNLLPTDSVFGHVRIGIVHCL